jgi:hypothetical protein
MNKIRFIVRITCSKAPEGQNIGNKQLEKSISAPAGRNIVSYSQKTPLLRPSGAKNTEVVVLCYQYHVPLGLLNP